MGYVKSEADHVLEPEPAPSLLARLVAWLPSTSDRAQDRDPALWMHRDVTV